MPTININPEQLESDRQSRTIERYSNAIKGTNVPLTVSGLNLRIKSLEKLVSELESKIAKLSNGGD